MTTATPCPSCEEAAERATTGRYTSGCLECSCRALAHSPEAWKATHALTNAPLQQSMQTLAKGDAQQYAHIRARVWHWIGRLQGVKP